MNSLELWKERFSLFATELQKYMRYIFNGHLLFVLVIGIGGLAYYYSEWVKTLDESFPAAIILALIIALPLTKSPVYSLLKEPDMFFLLPVEKKMDPYFRKAIRISFAFQGYILLMLLAAGMPLYAAVEKGTFNNFIVILLFILAAKYMNLIAKWNVDRFQEASARLADRCVRFCLNFVLLYFLFSNGHLAFAAVVLLILAMLSFYYKKAAADKLLKWEYVIEAENKRMHSFYRFANMFTDVPKLKEKISRRKWLDPILALVPYSQSNTYRFLYIRTFLRSGDYLGLFIRLTVIGAIVIVSLDTLIPQMIGAGLFVYMTGFQLIIIRKHHESLIWHDLYPVAKERKNKDVQFLLLSFLAVQIAVFALLSLLSNGFTAAVMVLITCLAVLALLNSYYKKVTKSDEDKWD